MPKIELDTDDAASHRCANCGHLDRPVTLVVDSRLYCGRNCAAHMAARSMVGSVSHSVNEGRGGSPEAIAAAERLLEHLKGLQQVHPGEDSCPRCWLQMQYSHDGKTSYRCVYNHPEEV